MESQLTKRGRGRELAVVLHGPHGSPKEMQGVSKAIGERSEDLDILAPFLPYGGFFGLFRTTPVEQIVRAVVEEIDKALANRERRGDGGAVARHMWNGPPGKHFLQTLHPAGTVRSYVRPFSAVIDRRP